MMTNKQNEFHKAADNLAQEGAWEVWHTYEIGGTEGSRYIHAPKRYLEGGEPKQNTSWSYKPLVGQGGLFFEFARLADDGGLDSASTPEELDTDRNANAALEWVSVYGGVLGLTTGERRGRRYWSTRGGKMDTVARFAEEAWIASRVLRLYEAATREGGPDIEAISGFMEEEGMGSHEIRLLAGTPEAARESALLKVTRDTQEPVARYCYPALYRRGDHNHFVQGSGFSNLLGALWLEMFWLILSDDARRCRNPECNRIVPFEPTPARDWFERNDRGSGYATRTDKVYCSKRCANRHFYLTRTKPRRRQAASET
jgi:hypothetical protein